MTFGASAIGAEAIGAGGGPGVAAAYALSPSPLGSAAIRARYGTPASAWASAPSPLGASRIVCILDFTGALDPDDQDRYVMDLIVDEQPLRLKISSWQATIQSGRANYVQAVIPAAGEWIDAIQGAQYFVVSRRSKTIGGEWIEHEMARAPVEQWSLDQGPQRATATISGYTAVPLDTGDTTAASYTRQLPGLRSLSLSPGGVRARCAIDWLLRPGHRAIAGAQNFVVSYINYYVNANDSYCDVGERV